MRRLWQIAIEIGKSDDDFVNALRGAAKARQAPVYGQPQQPDVDALKQIDGILRTRGIVLPIYELAEVNRWMLLDKNPPDPPAGQPPYPPNPVITSLRAFCNAVGASTNPTEAFSQAAGMLMFDGVFRLGFAQGTSALLNQAFAITKEQEDALRAQITPSGAADIAADLFFELGWPGGSCLSRFVIYEDYVHPNL